MCKEMPVILVSRVVDKKKNKKKKWRAEEEEERHKGTLTKNVSSEHRFAKNVVYLVSIFWHCCQVLDGILVIAPCRVIL
jgi:hypothetical protein